MHERFVSRREVLWLTAASFVAATTQPSAAQDATVRIATTVSEPFAEPLYADELGFYKKAGLSVSIQRYSGGEPSIAAVVSNNADIGITTPMQLADAVVHGVPVRLIGWSGQYSSREIQPALYVTKDSSLHTAADLVGKTIAVNALGTMNFLGVQAWLWKNGIDISKVRPIEIPFAAITAALERGTADAGVLGEPFITEAGDAIRMLAPAFDVMGPHWSICAWFSKIDYIRSNAALIKRCMEVAYETAKYVNTHPAAANPIIAKYSKIPLATVAAMMHTELAETPNPASVRIQLDYAYQFKLLPRRLSAEDLTSTS